MVKYDRVYTGGQSVIIDTEEEGSIDFYLDGNLVNGESVTINGIADGTAQVLSWDGLCLRRSPLQPRGLRRPR